MLAGTMVAVSAIYLSSLVTNDIEPNRIRRKYDIELNGDNRLDQVVETYGGKLIPYINTRDDKFGNPVYVRADTLPNMDMASIESKMSQYNK